MSSVKQRHAQLAQTLYARTLAKDISWAIDSWDQKLATELAGFKLVIERGEDENNEPVVFVTIKDNAGAFVDGFSDSDLSGLTPSVDDHSVTSFWILMDRLEKTARRQAMGADDALDKILSELDDNVPF